MDYNGLKPIMNCTQFCLSLGHWVYPYFLMIFSEPMDVYWEGCSYWLSTPPRGGVLRSQVMTGLQLSSISRWGSPWNHPFLIIHVRFSDFPCSKKKYHLSVFMDVPCSINHPALFMEVSLNTGSLTKRGQFPAEKISVVSAGRIRSEPSLRSALAEDFFARKEKEMGGVP